MATALLGLVSLARGNPRVAAGATVLADAGGFLGALAAWPLAGQARQPGKVHVVLWLSTEAQPDPFIAGFRDGMRKLGLQKAELSWILEDNLAMRTVLEQVGGKVYKTYRMYEKPLG